MVSAASYVATANGATASCIMTAANVKAAAIVATATATSTTSDNRVLPSNPTSASSAATSNSHHCCQLHCCCHLESVMNHCLKLLPMLGIYQELRKLHREASAKSSRRRLGSVEASLMSETISHMESLGRYIVLGYEVNQSSKISIKI